MACLSQGTPLFQRLEFQGLLIILASPMRGSLRVQLDAFFPYLLSADFFLLPSCLWARLQHDNAGLRPGSQKLAGPLPETNLTPQLSGAGRATLRGQRSKDNV